MSVHIYTYYMYYVNIYTCMPRFPMQVGNPKVQA